MASNEITCPHYDSTTAIEKSSSFTITCKNVTCRKASDISNSEKSNEIHKTKDINPVCGEDVVSVCDDASDDAQKPCTNDEICICEEDSSSVSETSDESIAPCIDEKVCVCGNESLSTCHTSQDSQEPCADEQICVCGKDSSSSSDTSVENICVDEQICVCGKDSSSSSDTSVANICVDEQICVCGNDSSSSSDTSVANICVEMKTCGNRSSSLSSSSSGDGIRSICESEELFTCTCAPLAACYNMVEESDPLVEELLKQLPRVGYTEKSRDYWEMMLHCERAAFRRTASNLCLPSREARFYWHLYSTAMKNSCSYQKRLNQALFVTLNKLKYSEKRRKGISVWEQLIRLRTYDRLGRKNVMNLLERIIRKQTSLESICLEGLSLTPDEGVRLLLALYNSRKTMRYVYCWRTFEKMVGLTVDTVYAVKSGYYTNKRIQKCDWFRAIGCLEFLTTLSVNYAYIATPTGDLLISLAKKLGANWRWLQLLCLEEEIVEKTECGLNVDKAMIPDRAWAAVHYWAPVLKVQYAIIGIPQYDVHKKFFTKNTPIHTFALSTAIDLRFRQPWYLDCTIKTLCTWYSNSLVYLCLQLWHNRQDLDEQLRKLFIYLPSLRVFEFIGEIRTLKTLCGMCCQIRSGRCNVCRVHMQLQDVVHNENFDKEKWVRSVKCLMVCFKCDFDRMGVKFDVDFYCC